MKTIYKYSLELTDAQIVNLPEDAEVLSVREQNHVLCLWALVDTKAKSVPTKIRIFGTGHPFDLDEYKCVFIDTVLASNGLVWHVFLEL